MLALLRIRDCTTAPGAPRQSHPVHAERQVSRRWSIKSRPAYDGRSGGEAVETSSGKRTAHLKVQIVEDGDTIEMWVREAGKNPIVSRRKRVAPVRRRTGS
jgi:hypothetical protein